MVLHPLGAGFPDKVYENALVHELRESGLTVSQQHRMVLRYDGITVGEYAADLLVEPIVLVEWKVAKGIDQIHQAQCLNYLKAAALPLHLPTSAALPGDQTIRPEPIKHCRHLRILRVLRFHFRYWLVRLLAE